MPIYQDGKIYRLVCNKTGLAYVGSTCETIQHRYNAHRNKYDAWKAGKTNRCGSFRIVEGNDFRIELIENYPCNSKIELTQRERHWFDIEKQHSTLCNVFLPHRFYADLQAQRKRTDAKRATNPERIASKKSSNRRRYLLRKELLNYNLFD
jgi:hypothetical protein